VPEVRWLGQQSGPAAKRVQAQQVQLRQARQLRVLLWGRLAWMACFGSR
jgi:hypothetical protein